MANEKPVGEVDTMAFEIFKDRMAMGNAKRGVETEAMLSFKMAEAFLKVRTAIARGEVKTKDADGPHGADCRAPNLKRTHPHNLVSREVGDLARVAVLRRWLDKNPTPETDPQELAHRLNREFSDLGWDLPTINVARAIFPSYCTN